MKKFLALFMAFLLVCALLPTQTLAATINNTATKHLGQSYIPIVQEEFLAYVNTLPAADASAAVSQLVDHALTGKGKKLILKETDPFFVACLRSNVMQAGIIDAVATAIESLIQSEDSECLMRLNASLYKNNPSYSLHRVDPEHSTDLADYSKIKILQPNFGKTYTFSEGELNACDEALILVMGDCFPPVRVKKSIRPWRQSLSGYR